MVEQLSPLEPVYRHGRHGNPEGEPGIVLTETRPGSTVQLGCWPGRESDALAAISSATGLAIANLPRAGAVSGHRSGFGIGPGLWLLTDQAEGLAGRLEPVIDSETGTVTDLSHGRTAIRSTDSLPQPRCARGWCWFRRTPFSTGFPASPDGSRGCGDGGPKSGPDPVLTTPATPPIRRQPVPCPVVLRGSQD